MDKTGNSFFIFFLTVSFLGLKMMMDNILCLPKGQTVKTEPLKIDFYSGKESFLSAKLFRVNNG